MAGKKWKKKEVVAALEAAGVDFDESKTAKQLADEFSDVLVVAGGEADPVAEAETPIAVLTEVPNELQGETCTDELFLQGKADPTDEACTACKALQACMDQQAALTGAKAAKKGNGRKRATKSSESKKFIEDMIATGKHTRKEIMESYLAKYPTHAPSTVGPYLSDSKNPKYQPFALLATIDKKTKAFSFVAAKEVKDAKAA